eukprot:TRINITY_DN573_c0_g1_i1.p1 TRINITY_DN573_c0_g1~~TRINITY_DN573_c0_g1_i1.p1  ORF type:complete len:717 (-),score=152.42 TRINITY_DN573_c0_g1_i1:121-2271(-)
MPFLKRLRKALVPERPHIPADEQLLLSPWQKWTRYGRFPYKLVIHALMAFFMTVQLYIYAGHHNRYEFDQKRAFVFAFLKEPVLDLREAEYGTYTHETRTIPDFLASINNTVFMYYEYPSIAVDRYRHHYDDDMIIVPIRMEVEMYRESSLSEDLDSRFHHRMDKSTITEYYDIDRSNPLGPFNTSNIREMLDSLVSIEMSFVYETSDLSYVVPHCLEWKIHHIFDATSGGVIREYLLQDIMNCDGSVAFDEFLTSEDLWSSFIVIFLSLCSLFLTVLQILRSFKIYQESRKRHAHLKGPSYRAVAFHNLPWRDKLRFFNLWFFITIISAVFCIVSSIFTILSMTYQASARNATALFLGFACFLSCINLVRYFEFTPRFYLLIMSLQKGMPNVLRFVIGVLPIFFGYALLGTAMFGAHTQYFATVDQACVTLFAVLNGDVLRDTYDLTDSMDPWLSAVSRAYLYTFIALFIYAVLNIFILIMEDAFFTVKEGGHNEMSRRIISEFVTPIVLEENESDTASRITKTFSGPYQMHPQELGHEDDRKRSAVSERVPSHRDETPMGRKSASVGMEDDVIRSGSMTEIRKRKPSAVDAATASVSKGPVSTLRREEGIFGSMDEKLHDMGRGLYVDTGTGESEEKMMDRTTDWIESSALDTPAVAAITSQFVVFSRSKLLGMLESLHYQVRRRETFSSVEKRILERIQELVDILLQDSIPVT